MPVSENMWIKKLHMFARLYPQILNRLQLWFSYNIQCTERRELLVIFLYIIKLSDAKISTSVKVLRNSPEGILLCSVNQNGFTSDFFASYFHSLLLWKARKQIIFPFFCSRQTQFYIKFSWQNTLFEVVI